MHNVKTSLRYAATFPVLICGLDTPGDGTHVFHLHGGARRVG